MHQSNTVSPIVVDSLYTAAQQTLVAWLTAALGDWGTGLDVSLYEDAVTRFYGGPEEVLGFTQFWNHGKLIGRQPVRLAMPNMDFKVTTMHPNAYREFEDHARRFLAHSTLVALEWINIAHGQVLFKILKRE
jgi:hypothetical protein